jgi:hypothetical protein
LTWEKKANGVQIIIRWFLPNAATNRRDQWSRPARVRARLGCKHVRIVHPRATNDNELSGWGSDRPFYPPVPQQYPLVRACSKENVRFNLSDPALVEAWHIYNVFRSKLKNKK